jgi:hypothetical protein
MLTKFWLGYLKRPLGRPRHRWEDNIKETGCEGVDWFHQPQNRIQWWVLVNTVMNLWVPEGEESLE